MLLPPHRRVPGDEVPGTRAARGRGQNRADRAGRKLGGDVVRAVRLPKDERPVEGRAPGQVRRWVRTAGDRGDARQGDRVDDPDRGGRRVAGLCPFTGGTGWPASAQNSSPWGGPVG